MKAIIIARVSTEEQREAGLSLPAQVSRLERYCENKGFPIIQSFSFDESAYKDERGEFDRIFNFIIQQKEKVAICCDKVDRLSRNMFDKRVSFLYDKALLDEIELHFISDGQIINSKISAAEKFHFGISLGLAKYYSDAISDNVKRALEQKLRRGEWPAKAPFGYKNITLPDGKADIMVDPYTSTIVQSAFEWYGTGAYSMDLLCKKLNAEFALRWAKGYLDHILKTEFYMGMMNWKNNTHPHKYPTIISKTLYERVQQVKQSFNKKPVKLAGQPYIYRGLLRCAHCGLAITPEKHKGHVYYHCTQSKGKHGAKWLREEEITEQLGMAFKRMQLPKEVIQNLSDIMDEVHKNKVEFQTKQFDELIKEQQTLTRMMDNLYIDKLKGSITESEYERFYHSFKEKRDDVLLKMEQLQEAENNYYDTAKMLLVLASKAYDLFESSGIEKRRLLIKLALQNLGVDGENVVWEAQKPFDTMIKFGDSHKWCAR